MTKSQREIFQNFIIEDLGVSYETMENFDNYYNLICKWQKQINIISNTENIWTRHFLDSVQLSKYISNKNFPIIDLGSGGGLPAIPLLMVGHKNLSLIESDRKKCIFLKEAIRISRTNSAVFNERIENANCGPADIITSRACAPLGKLLAYAQRFVSHETHCLFLKGKTFEKEILDAKKDWQFDYKVIPSITSDEGVILSVTNLQGGANL